MSKRSGSSFTGANAVPLGPRNPAIGSKRTFSATPPSAKPSLLSAPMKQQNSVSNKASEALRAAQAAAASLQQKMFGGQMMAPAPPMAQVTPAPPPLPSDSTSDGRGRPRKKRSRWGAPDTKIDIPGIPSSMPANLSKEQQKAYIVQLQIEDVTRKLKSGNLGIPANPEDRSPSPEPIYNNEGKRLNTREYRTRKRLEEERHKLIQDMTMINENYKPPIDYKPPIQRISEQINIPSDLNPSINFVGLLIGPRGNTLKKIEKESNCKIMIRGKGSVKEGKIGRKDGLPLPGEDEPLHALITGTRIEDVQKASKEINRIIKQGIEQPEGQNDLRKLQLMELARLNGTLRDDAMPREREWLKPENQNITNTTICTKCGGRGHLVQDCMSQAPSVGLQQQEQGPAAPMNQADKAKMDSEYMSLMAELGEGPAADANNGGKQQFGGQRPPWMSGGQRGQQFGGQMGGYNNSSGGYGGSNMMGGNRGGPWMRGSPRGGRGGNFNQRGGPRGGGGRGGGYGGGQNNYQQQNNYGGYGQEYAEGNMQQQGGMWMGGQQQYDPNMGYGGMDGSGMGMMNPPPPPPPGSAPQPPPPPSSGTDDGSWQQNQWGGEGGQMGEKGENIQDGSDYSGNQNNMMGYGSMMGYGMWGGNTGGGMGQPPMPPGPGPVPPPPPSGANGDDGAPGDQSGNANNQQWGMDYNNMGYNMGMGMSFGMPPAPPPPPPSSS